MVCPLLFGLIDDTSCWFTLPYPYTAYLVSLVLFLYVLPTLVMVVCYFLTANKLFGSNKFLKFDKRGCQKQQRQRSRLAIIVIIMSIAFIFCTSFLYVWLIVFRVSPHHPFVQNTVVNELKSLLNKINSIINPIILYLMSSTHRRYFLKTFLCCFDFSSKVKRNKSQLTMLTQHPSLSFAMTMRQSVITRQCNPTRTLRNGMTPIKEEDFNM